MFCEWSEGLASRWKRYLEAVFAVLPERRMPYPETPGWGGGEKERRTSAVSALSAQGAAACLRQKTVSPDQEGTYSSLKLWS